jgi:hypothetical protein
MGCRNRLAKLVFFVKVGPAITQQYLHLPSDFLNQIQIDGGGEERFLRFSCLQMERLRAPLAP